MADTPVPSGTVPVTDRRTPPRGVLPRGIQTWLMAGLGAGVVLVAFLTGQPEPSPRPPASSAPQAPVPDRVRAYQDHLRTLEARHAQEAQTGTEAEPRITGTQQQDGQPAPPQDPIVAERRRREYESLFASNVVLSRRADLSSRPDAERFDSASRLTSSGISRGGDASIDDIADAVIRATLRSGATTTAASGDVRVDDRAAKPPNARLTEDRPTRTDPISAAGPLHTILEGTIIETVLTNRLDGTAAAPVNCLVTTPLYSHSGQHVLIPAGARMLGEAKPVQTFGDARLTVAFHRLLLPDGSTVSLDQFRGLNQRGDAGLYDRVNQHYWSTFGAAAAVGLISGLAQAVGTAGLAGGTGDRTVVIAGGTADAASQSSLQVMQRFLNRLPTITIREGHQVKVYLTSDLELPAYIWPPAHGRS